jgi:metal-responsive CopG/Arc/MetJ family transcriptional regulator
MKKPTVWISLRVPKELRDKLDRLSREDKRSRSDYIRIALENYLARA